MEEAVMAKTQTFVDNSNAAGWITIDFLPGVTLLPDRIPEMTL
jgi:hypothetical protein